MMPERKAIRSKELWVVKHVTPPQFRSGDKVWYYRSGDKDRKKGPYRVDKIEYEEEPRKYYYSLWSERKHKTSWEDVRESHLRRTDYSTQGENLYFADRFLVCRH